MSNNIIIPSQKYTLPTRKCYLRLQDSLCVYCANKRCLKNNDKTEKERDIFVKDDAITEVTNERN